MSLVSDTQDKVDCLLPYLVGTYKLRKEDIAPGSDAIANQHWQLFRVSMKGKPTERKLDMLRLYIVRRTVHANNNAYELNLIKIRVQNYINALKRGGQLTKEGEIKS